jgi:hypothetical protein
MFMVDRDMMNPIATPHHQLAIWKNRSPALSTELSGFMLGKELRMVVNLHAMHWSSKQSLQKSKGG